MPRTSQAILKQHDRKTNDLRTIVEQERLLRGTVRTYQSAFDKNYKAYVDWAKVHDIIPEKITLSKPTLSL